jgi:MFS family permease
VRAGRKLHLTDMAEDAFRARYTALSNTLIGLALLVGGLFGLAADRFGPAPVLLAFAVIAALGAALARGLDEVQQA